jgi:dTDP-4-amino-4,6-dideoxygalactose transaminase
MGMSYGGHAGETAALAELCAGKGIAFLEDAAHGAGSRLDGRHLGTFGVAGAYSMFSNKNLAVGEGGLVTTDDEDLAARMRLLRSHGMTTMSWDRHRGHATTYDVVALGFNYRIDEARATLATRRLAKLDGENDARRRLDGRYRELLADLDVECALAPAEGLRSAHHLFTIVVPEGADRDGVRQALADARIQTSMHYPPAHHFSMYESAGAELPVTDAYAARTATLPMYAHMTDDQQDLVVDALSGALSSRGAAAGRPA